MKSLIDMEWNRKLRIKRFKINLYKFMHYKYIPFNPFKYDILREECLRPLVRENRRCTNRLGKIINRRSRLGSGLNRPKPINDSLAAYSRR